MSEAYIYGEYETENGPLRYVGKTKHENLLIRQEEHHYQAKMGARTYHHNWLRSLSAPPVVKLLAKVPDYLWEGAEQYWIALGREYGCKLTNATGGGEGLRNPTKETRAKMSASRKGQKMPPEARAKIAAAGKGRKFSLETRAKISAARKRNEASPEARARIYATTKDRPRPIERKKRSTNTIGYRGVTRVGEKFQASCAAPGLRSYLGLFDSAAGAAFAVDKRVHEYFPVGSFLNFPFIPYE